MDYDLIVVKTLERVYKNYYYIIRGVKVGPIGIMGPYWATTSIQRKSPAHSETLTRKRYPSLNDWTFFSITSRSTPSSTPLAPSW